MKPGSGRLFQAREFTPPSISRLRTEVLRANLTFDGMSRTGIREGHPGLGERATSLFSSQRNRNNTSRRHVRYTEMRTLLVDGVELHNAFFGESNIEVLPGVLRDLWLRIFKNPLPQHLQVVYLRHLLDFHLYE